MENVHSLDTSYFSTSMGTTTDNLPQEELNTWLSWMRDPVDNDTLFKTIWNCNHYGEVSREPQSEPASGYDDFLGGEIPVEDDDPCYPRYAETTPNDEEVDYGFDEYERKWIEDMARMAPKALAYLRSQPVSGYGMMPQPWESAWMTQKERDLIEWFDRGEYAVFLRLCATFDFRDGWVVPCCFNFCVKFMKGLRDRPRESLLDMLYGNELINKVKVAACEGNARALNMLGIFSKYGCLGISFYIHRDPKAARDYFRRSAECGCTSGKSNYASALENGFGGEVDLEGAERIYRELSAQGLGFADYSLARLSLNRRRYNIDTFNPDAFVGDLLRGAERGEANASAIISAAKGDLTPDRLRVEFSIHASLLANKRKLIRDSDENVSFSVCLRDDSNGKDRKASEDRKWVASQLPEGVVVPPTGGRETMRTPNLTSTNPSFAARLIIFVRDRFGGDAPAVYNAAHISRKTYSSIISNELRPVSKQTAISLALGLRLNSVETQLFLKSAGFALSMFILEDMIVEACIKAGVHDINRVNEILSAHGAKTFPPVEEDHQLEEQK